MERRIVAPPTIWLKDSTKISVYPDEEKGVHKEPHIHVDYQNNQRASIRISDGAVLSGSLPNRLLKWCREYFLKLFSNDILEMLKKKVFYRLDRRNSSNNKQANEEDVVYSEDFDKWDGRSIVTVVVLSTYVLRFLFKDGSVKDFDLEPVIHRKFYNGMYQPMIDNPGIIADVKIEPCGGGIYWDDVMGFDGNWIYENGVDVL